MKNTNQTQDNRSSREIQTDIRKGRDNMDQTLDSLNDRLSPRALIHSLMDWFDDRDRSSNQELSRIPKQVARFVRDNPVPALLTGVGVAWLIAESQSDDDESDFEPSRVDNDRYDDNLTSDYRRGSGEPEGLSGESRFSTAALPAGPDTPDDDGESVTDKVKQKFGDASDAMSSAASATRDKVSDARDGLVEQGGRAKNTIKGWAADGSHAAGRASDQLQRGYAKAEVRIKEAVNDYPLGFGAGFVGLGLLAGLLLPRSEAEDEWLGEAADEIKDAVTDKGGDLLERGHEVVDRIAEEAVEEAERQGLTVDSAASGLESIGEKVAAVVQAGKEEGKKAAQDEHLMPEDIKSEVHAEAERTKNKTVEQLGK